MGHYYHLLSDLLPILWRRKGIIFSFVIVSSIVAFLAYAAMGERYESYTLLRVGQGIKDRSAGTSTGPFGEGADLSSRIDSLARLVATDHVIREAAKNTGFDQILQTRNKTLFSTLPQVAANLVQALPKQFSSFQMFSGATDTGENRDIALVAWLRELISAKQEGKSDLLRISFRYPDPTVAARFLTELANALVAVQADLVQVPGADVFFEQQAKRLELEAEKAATELQTFSVGAAIYSVAEQRALLLRRANELSTQISATRGQIQERRGQKQSIVDQLLVLRPVTGSKAVTGIVNNLGAKDYAVTPNAAGNVSNFDDTPPLLLIRVYQDAVASLVKVNSDLNGAIKLETLFGAELDRVNAELASLSSKESEYDQLKRVLTRASGAADHYGTRVIEEKINMDIAKKTQLSSVRVIQAADKPLNPIFPQKIHFVLLALLGGLAAGSAIVLLMELARLNQQEAERAELENAISERGIRSLRDREYKVAGQAAE
jgi:succinoglycan biosynthesis transport protein ExoP